MMPTFCDIPDDLFLKILSYFSHKELCKSVVPVSRKWRDLAYDPTLWKEFNIGPSVSVESLKVILRRSRLLEQLSWETVPSWEVPPILKSVGDWCGLCPQLQVFKCTNFKDIRWYSCGKGMELEAIQTLLKTCKGLTHLAVPYSGSLYGFTKAVCDHRIIDRLGIYYIDRGKRKDLPFARFIVQVSGQFLQLKSIEMGYWGRRIIPDAVINALVTNQGSSLEEFTVVGPSISVEGVHLLAKCKSLKSLCLRHRQHLPLPAELKPGDAIFAAIKPMNLEQLNLSGCMSYCGDDTEREYFRREISDMFINGNLSGLTTLHLDVASHTRIIDDGVLKILIECCPELVDLQIPWNSITKVGVSAIVFGDNRLRKLCVLDMGYRSGLIGDYLLKIPESLPKLRKLSLSARESDSQVVDRLMENKELAKMLTVKFLED